jgi:hypothetical protein
MLDEIIWSNAMENQEPFYISYSKLSENIKKERFSERI